MCEFCLRFTLSPMTWSGSLLWCCWGPRCRWGFGWGICYYWDLATSKYIWFGWSIYSIIILSVYPALVLLVDAFSLIAGRSSPIWFSTTRLAALLAVKFLGPLREFFTWTKHNRFASLNIWSAYCTPDYFFSIGVFSLSLDCFFTEWMDLSVICLFETSVFNLCYYACGFTLVSL